jgi:hypothetical protein
LAQTLVPVGAGIERGARFDLPGRRLREQGTIEKALPRALRKVGCAEMVSRRPAGAVIHQFSRTVTKRNRNANCSA